MDASSSGLGCPSSWLSPAAALTLAEVWQAAVAQVPPPDVCTGNCNLSNTSVAFVPLAQDLQWQIVSLNRIGLFVRLCMQHKRRNHFSLKIQWKHFSHLLCAVWYFVKLDCLKTLWHRRQCEIAAIYIAKLHMEVWMHVVQALRSLSARYW